MRLTKVQSAHTNLNVCILVEKGEYEITCTLPILCSILTPKGSLKDQNYQLKMLIIVTKLASNLLYKIRPNEFEIQDRNFRLTNLFSHVEDRFFPILDYNLMGSTTATNLYYLLALRQSDNYIGES